MFKLTIKDYFEDQLRWIRAKFMALALMKSDTLTPDLKAPADTSIQSRDIKTVISSFLS